MYFKSWSTQIKNTLRTNIDKVKTISVDFYKVNNVVDNDVAKKTVFDKWVAKVNVIDTSGFVLKTQYNIDKSGLEKKIGEAAKKILDTSGLV